MTNFNSLYQLSDNKKLTDREITCLHLASLDKTAKESAIILNIAPSTVEEHRKSIKQKLYCKTIAGAVYKGIQAGYLPMSRELDFLTQPTGEKSHD
jgi:DNA-binding CsgD family transcriptional regulator